MWNHPGIRKIVKSRGKFRTIIQQISLLNHWVLSIMHPRTWHPPHFSPIGKSIFQTVIQLPFRKLSQWVLIHFTNHNSVQLRLNHWVFQTIIKQISLLNHWVIESSHSCLTEFPVFQTIIKQISPLNHWVIRSSHSCLTNFFDIYLFADTDVSLPDENTGMMDWLCKSKLEHLGLETPFQEILNFEAEHIIEIHTVFIQNTNAY